ncbi:hypothetical protein B0H17DRAFT_426227 [Mycena rosella]|uniref:F-box domain-containing protein n=1 Tax=Mycena rosella TaxID=1033263 RepID=A0AAD7DN48_MYCRO|nr:hypothetical protein B0H17DRAFT_426227 [Mycena rosella]
MQCPRAGDQDQVLRNPDPHIAPLLLVRICARWRHIALATPMLWTEMQLILANSNWLDGKGVPWKLVLMNNWVVNASPLPISFAARCDSYEVLTRALSVTNRFKALHLRLSAQSIRALRGRIPRTRLDAESLQIDIADSAFREPHLYSSFKNSASLRSFTLISATPGVQSALLQFSLPWAQLTHMSIDEPLFFASMTVLVQCINLVNCTFGTLAPFDDEDDVALQGENTLPFLTDANFTFDDLDWVTAEHFLKPLILPTLKKLVLKVAYPPVQWSATAFSHFQMRSAFNLEMLELDMLIATEDLRGLLGSLPSLKNFTSTQISDAVALFSLLTFNGPNGLLPQLECLKFNFIQSDISLEAFIAMIRSRRKRLRAPAPGTLMSRLEHLHIISAKGTLPLDRWWWPLKLELVFPKLELEFECTGTL